jgi:hypothetical protein
MTQEVNKLKILKGRELKSYPFLSFNCLKTMVIKATRPRRIKKSLMIPVRFIPLLIKINYKGNQAAQISIIKVERSKRLIKTNVNNKRVNNSNIFKRSFVIKGKGNSLIMIELNTFINTGNSLMKWLNCKEICKSSILLESTITVNKGIVKTQFTSRRKVLA